LVPEEGKIMVKVTIKPWEEVIIHESIQHVLEDFIKICGVGVQPGGLAPPLLWAEGIVFRSGPMPSTDSITKEMLENKVHWVSVEWAIMPKYQQVIMINEINARIPIINVSATAILCDVAKTLKTLIPTT
jgi:hypothetical protein